jgi:hypothetical protein
MPNAIASTEIIQMVLRQALALAFAAAALMATQTTCAGDTSGAPARVMPATGTAQPVVAPLPGPVERTCAPWDGPALEFAAKAGDSWLIADIWRSPSDIGPGDIQLGDAKKGSVRICTDRVWTGPGSCRVVKRGTVKVSKAAAGFYAGSIEAEGIKAQFEGQLPNAVGTFCG